jgi:hypothetical protein
MWKVWFWFCEAHKRVHVPSDALRLGAQSFILVAMMPTMLIAWLLEISVMLCKNIYHIYN